MTLTESFLDFQNTPQRSSWSGEQQSCQFYSGVSFKVFFAKMGYTDNPQNYIVKIEKSAALDTWKYTRSDSQAQAFTHSVSVQFIEVSQTNLTNQGYIEAPKQTIPPDFWYPFYIRSGSIALAC